MTEIQPVLYNKEIFEGVVGNLLKNFIYYENYQGDQFNTTLTPLDPQHVSVGQQFFNYFKIINNLIHPEDVYYSIEELLSDLFDKFIEGILLYLKETKNKISLSFKDLYNIFHSFGLRKIYPETLDKINASIQWKICSPDFINPEFLKTYKNSLLPDISRDTIKSIDDLLLILKIFEKEKKDLLELENDVSEIILD
ncbi:MAG: hypothetical protein ACTSXU_01000 [Promethearchaeota archaeon]